MGLTLRTLKGSRLTHEELDDNFRHFTGSHTVDGTVTATGFVGDGSGLTGVTAAANLTGTGIVSGSVQLDGERFGFGADIEATGSFTGSFVGDGSGLTGIAGGASAIHLLSDVNINTLSDGEYLSYDAASSKWLNVGAPATDLTGTNVISGSNLAYNDTQATWQINAKHFKVVDGLMAGTDLFTVSKGSLGEFAVHRGGVPTNGAGYRFTKENVNVEDASLRIYDTATSTIKAQIDNNGTALLNSLNVNYAAAINGDIISLKNVNHSISSGRVFKVTAGNTTSEIFRVNGDKEMVINASMVISDFDGSTPASADFTSATEGVSGSFSGSFEGDGSGLTGIPAGNVPLIAGLAPGDLPLPANSVTGSMILIEFTPPGMGALPELGLYIYTGQSSSGWKSITLN